MALWSDRYTGQLCRVYASATGQTILTGGLDFINVNATEVRDSIYTVDLAADTIQVLVAGTFMASWELKFTNGGAGSRFAAVYKNSATLLRETGVRSVGGTGVQDTSSGSGSIKLAVNDTVRLAGYVDGGSTVTIVTGQSYETGLTLVFLG